MGVKRIVKKKDIVDYSIEEVFEIFKTEKLAYGIQPITIRNYEESLKRFAAAAGDEAVYLSDLNKTVIINFIYTLQEAEVRDTTINHYLRELRAFFNWCYKEEYLRQKLDIKLIKTQEAAKETYTEEELSKLLIMPSGNDFVPWRSWAIINWILATGNRERTVCNIKIGDINFQEKEIVLLHTKNKKVQIIPMSSELVTVIKKYVRDFRSDADYNDYLFCNVAGERLTEKALQLSIRDYNFSRGVTRTSVHALRHTFAKYWIRNSGDAFRLQKMLGHSTLDMTRNYVNMFSADLKDGFDNFSPLDKMVKKAGLKHTVRRQQPKGV